MSTGQDLEPRIGLGAGERIANRDPVPALREQGDLAAAFPGDWQCGALPLEVLGTFGAQAEAAAPLGQVRVQVRPNLQGRLRGGFIASLAVRGGEVEHALCEFFGFE